MKRCDTIGKILMNCCFLLMFGTVVWMGCICIGCKSDSKYIELRVKGFLFEFPNYQMKIDDSPFFDKYINNATLNKYLPDSCCISVVIALKNIKNDKIIEILASGDCKNRQIFGLAQDRKVLVRRGCCWPLIFKIIEKEEKIIELKPTIKSKTEEVKKEEKTMSLSLGTWIMLIIVMVIVTKVAHKIGLKTIFRPTKKAAAHVEKEWKDS